MASETSTNPQEFTRSARPWDFAAPLEAQVANWEKQKERNLATD